MSQNRFGIKTVTHKKLFLELTKNHGIEPLAAMKTIDALELEKGEIFKINDIRNTSKTRGGLTITVYKKTSIPNTGKSYEKEVKKIKTHPDGNPSRLEFYDSMPGLPDRAGGNKPALIEWWPSGDKKKEVFYKNNVKHRDNGPAEISYDKLGDPIEQKYFTMGVPQEKIEAGKKQEAEFNKQREEKRLAQIFKTKDDREREKAERRKRNQQKLITRNLRAASPKDKSWMNQSGDERIEVDLDSDLFNPQPLSSIFTKKSEDKKELELPKQQEPVQVQPTPESEAETETTKDSDDIESILKKYFTKDKPKDDETKNPAKQTGPQIKDKSLYSKIIDNISKFLTKKHKEKLTPEVLKKIEDYYTSRVQPKKATPKVPDQFKKEYTGRRREEFPIGAHKKAAKNESKIIDSDISESIINEAIELTEELISKYKEKLF